MKHRKFTKSLEVDCRPWADKFEMLDRGTHPQSNRESTRKQKHQTNPIVHSTLKTRYWTHFPLDEEQNNCFHQVQHGTKVGYNCSYGN